MDELASALNAQYIDLESKYARTSDLAVLREALSRITEAVEQTDNNKALLANGARSVYLTNLARCHFLLYKATGDSSDLEKAIERAHSAIEASPKDAFILPMCHVTLSDALSASFTTRGGIKKHDLEEALDHARLAVDAAYRANEYIHEARSTLASRLAQCFEFLTKDDKLMEEAIRIRKDLVETVPKDGTLYGAVLLDLAADYQDQYQRYGNLQDLDVARKYFQRGLAVFPPGHRLHGIAVRQYASMESVYADETGHGEWLGATLEMLVKTEESTKSQEDLAMLHFQKSRLYASNYNIWSDSTDLEESIIAAEAALATMPGASGLLPVMLCRISEALSVRATLEYSESDINAAVKYAMEALEAAGDNTAQQSLALTTIGNQLSKKFDIVGGVKNLEQALTYRRRALDMLPLDHMNRPNRLRMVAISLSAHFEQYGSIQFLDESIQLDRQASEGLPDGSPYRRMVLNGLSNTLAQRYRLTGNSRDLDEAIIASRDAVKGMSEGQVGHAAYLNGLSNRLATKFGQTRDRTYLDDAIDAVTRAVDSTKDESADQYIYLNTLSNAIFERYRAYEDQADLEKSIEICRQCLALPENSPPWITAYHNLGVRLQFGFQDSTDPAEKRKYIEEALAIAEKIVAMTPKNHPSRPGYLRHLAIRQLYFGMTMDGHSDEEIIAQMLLSASTSESAFNQTYDTPLARIDNANTAGYLYMAGKDWVSGARVLTQAVTLFHRVSPLSLDDNDRQRQLRGLSGNSALACSCHLALENTEKALEILESGRGIMANVSMGFHADLSNVRDADALLHDKYVALRNKLSQPLPENDGNSSHGMDAVAVRNNEVADFEALEEQIRNLKGLETFNRGLSAAEMMKLASSGPIVAFCTVDQRCDAIIVTADKIEHLPLPDLRNADIKARVSLIVGSDRLSKAPNSKRAVANKKMRALLTWLWDMAVRPVLEHLGLLGAEMLPFDKKTRLCWVTSGPLGLLPLHAAGKGEKTPGQNAYARVLSSYISSFSSLAFARRCQAKVDTSSPDMALITMPETPGGLNSLATEPEANAIKEAFAQTPTAQLEYFCQPTAEQVYKHISTSNVDMLHLACHAEPNLDDPSNTALLFGSDPSAPEPDVLPVSRLRRLHTAVQHNRRPLRLAYLSACCTAQQYDLRLIDENIHLASAFQLCGFPAVVGTLWEADDGAAVVIAKAFYEELFRLDRGCGEGSSDVERQSGYHVARALDYAVDVWRKRKVGRGSAAADVLAWANFVYIGA